MTEVIHIKIKEKIKKWLFADEILKIQELENHINLPIKELGAATRSLIDAEYEIEECRKLLTQFADMGVDVGFCSEDHSWAVICIAGKQEYVKFMPLEYKDARYVLDFLKRFQYSKQIIDSPLAFRNIVKDYILK